MVISIRSYCIFSKKKIFPVTIFDSPLINMFSYATFSWFSLEELYLPEQENELKLSRYHIYMIPWKLLQYDMQTWAI